MVTIILDFSGIFCKDWKLSSKVTKWDRKKARDIFFCFFQLNLCYKTTNCMFTNMFHFFIHKLAIGILGLCMAFLIPHLYKVLLSLVIKFFSITFYWEVSILFHIAVTCKRIKNGKYSQRSRPGQTSIAKYHRFPGHDEGLFYQECFYSLNITRDKLSHSGFSTRTRIQASAILFVYVASCTSW